MGWTAASPTCPMACRPWTICTAATASATARVATRFWSCWISKMPLLDGIGVLREIKGSDQLSNIPVVVLTSSTEPSDLQRAYDAGTNAYIAKPTEFAQFLSAMKHVCEFWININQPAPQAATWRRATAASATSAELQRAGRARCATARSASHPGSPGVDEAHWPSQVLNPRTRQPPAHPDACLRRIDHRIDLQRGRHLHRCPIGVLLRQQLLKQAPRARPRLAAPPALCESPAAPHLPAPWHQTRPWARPR